MAIEGESTTYRCANCSDDLEYAAYALGVQEGVIGGTGFVPTHLHDWLLFCSQKCASDYLAASDDPEPGYKNVRIP